MYLRIKCTKNKKKTFPIKISMLQKVNKSILLKEDTLFLCKRSEGMLQVGPKYSHMIFFFHITSQTETCANVEKCNNF